MKRYLYAYSIYIIHIYLMAFLILFVFAIFHEKKIFKQLFKLITFIISIDISNILFLVKFSLK